MDQKLLQYQIERTLYDLQKRRRITDCKSPVTCILDNQLMTHTKNGQSRTGSDRIILSIQGEVQRTGSNTPQQISKNLYSRRTEIPHCDFKKVLADN